MATRTLEGGERRKVDRMLNAGKDADEIAAYLLGKGWEPELAQETATREDRGFQDRLRETNMGRTHGSHRQAVRNGGIGLGALWLIFLAVKILKLLSD